MDSVKLGTILKMNKGKKPVAQSKIPKEGYLPYCDIKAFETGKIDSYTDGVKCVECDDGDVLIVCDGSRSGLVGYAIKGYVGSTLAKISAEGVDNKFLFYFLKSKYTLLNTNVKGTGTPHVNQIILKESIINVPSLDKQQRIVERIEELFSELNKEEETLLKIKSQLEIYKQAVLKEAFSGANYNAVNCKIKDVCESIKVGIVIKPAQYYTDEKTGIKSFRSANVREFHIEDKDWVYINEAGNKKNQRSIVHEGDILIVRSGYPGTACVVPKEYDGCNAIDILIASPKKDVILSDYLCAYTNSPFGKMLVREKKRGVAQAHLNVTGYSNLSISVPSIGQQQQILRKIDNMLSKYSSIERTIEDSIMRLNSLRQSILKEAFEGKLV